MRSSVRNMGLIPSTTIPLRRPAIGLLLPAEEPTAYNSMSTMTTPGSQPTGTGNCSEDLDVGYGFGTTGELRFGYEGGYEKLSPQIGNSTVLPTVSGGTGDVRLQYQLNTLDNPVIPRSGESILMYTKGYNLNPAAPGPFPLSEVQSQSFFRLNEPSSVFVGASGGSSYGYKAGIPAFSLGGSQRLVAWNTGELYANQYFLGQLGIIHELFKLPPLLGSNVELLGLYEVGKTYKLALGPKPPNFPWMGRLGSS